VPDLIPVLGYADDVLVIAVALPAVVWPVGAEAFDEHWTGREGGLVTVRRMAGWGRA
jgi:uncharacterized membrane protein YkvA (DUF1232 family)